MLYSRLHACKCIFKKKHKYIQNCIIIHTLFPSSGICNSSNSFVGFSADGTGTALTAHSAQARNIKFFIFNVLLGDLNYFT